MATAAFKHSSVPQPIVTAKHSSLYRDPASAGVQGTLVRPHNIMFDKRVVRGNTYSTHQGSDKNATQQNVVRRKRPQTKSREAIHMQENLRPETPEAVDGREHRDVQTENYLEEITDRVIEVDVVTQTDAFMDRPATPLYVPKKEGVDSETQIYEGDLFDFDTEVEPLLEILIGKTLEQGLMEVLEEEELANMRAHQEEFIELRNAELAETQRLEEAERRRFEEKERRLRQERDRQEKEREKKEIAAARGFAQAYLSTLETAVFNNLSETGYFHDPVLKEVENEFIPWLEERLTTHIDRAHVAHRLADDAIKQAFVLREKSRKEAVDRANAAEMRKQAEQRHAEVQRKDEILRIREEAARKAQAEAEAKRRAAELAAQAAREEEEESDEPPPPPKKKGGKK